jgi:hypothetical protein
MPTPAPSPADVARVTALDADPVLRNLLITYNYSRLSNGMRDRTGGADVNWCTLGTWASKTAGRFIRGDEVPGAFTRLLRGAVLFDDPSSQLAQQGVPGRAAEPGGLLGIATEIVNDVSTFILEGNKVVFGELAAVFAAFLDELGTDTSYDGDRLARFQAAYSEGDPQPDEAAMVNGRMVYTPKGGQGLLRQMIAGYYAAMFDRDEKTRAELLLLANARGGLHEQTRLQTYIAGSLNAPIQDTLLRRVHASIDASGGNAQVKAVGHTLADRLLPPLGRKLEDAWQDFSTLAMMELVLPDGSIHLGRPLPPEPDGPLVPPMLQTIADPTLAAVLAEYKALDIPVVHPPIESLGDRFAALLHLGHPVPLDAIGVETVDWVQFPQRMRYILTLFRSRMRDERLTQSPFTDAQQSAILANQVPAGPL